MYRRTLAEGEASMEFASRDYTIRFAVEIIDEIFSHCVLEDGQAAMNRCSEQRRLRSRNPEVCRDAPWNLAQVCWRWREITLARSALWRFVCITHRMSHHYIDNDDKQLDETEAKRVLGFKDACLALQLERSGSYSLTVKLAGALTDALCTAPGFQKLLASSDRWKHLKFELDYKTSQDLVIQLDHHLSHLPTLETLQVFTGYRLASIPNLASYAPKLWSFKTNVSEERDMLSSIPFSQITEFDSEFYAGMDVLAESIQEMTRITTLKLQLNGDGREEEERVQAPEPLALPLLQSLSVASIFTQDDKSRFPFVAPFRMFTVPGLQSLDIIDDSKTGLFPVDELRKMLQRSKPVLKHLRLVALTLDDEFSNLFASELCNLETMTLENMPPCTVSLILSKIVGALPKLRKVVIPYNEQWYPEALELVQELKEKRPNLIVEIYSSHVGGFEE
ncbi:hypothetical protein C8J56DRAFT_921282 [Mycena floridula]|nr:hypothetical protein C8J56DRAFT_921282 [Mycena floridula]